MLRIFNRDVPRDLPWTLGGSPAPWLMNCLRVAGPVERSLARRHISRLEESADGYRILGVRGYPGELRVSSQLPL
jgi:hypothetical protein